MPVETPQRRKTRPVNLNLLTIRFPVMAAASIFHRLSGFLLFLCIPVLLWALSLSLSSPDGFAAVQGFLTRGWMKGFLWVFLTALIYHFFAGFRHIAMDMGWGESLKAGKMTAMLVILSAVIFSALLGIYLW